MVGRMGRPGLIGTMARTAVITGTANAVSRGMNNRPRRAPTSARPRTPTTRSRRSTPSSSRCSR